ncbi:histone deacetylase 4-like isoform X2 [Centruroides vittatus]|uniref:histone deacetylase 4-like isoform X2 n=1 Tax=Centruroides vittatus TaxID=120091 RepID=UPI00350FB079
MTEQQTTGENLGSHHNMEINNHFSHIQRKEISNPGYVQSSIVERDQSGELPNNLINDSVITSSLQEQHLQFQRQLMQLKQQQQIQQQLLLQRFQQQQQQLAEQHEKQLQEQIKLSSRPSDRRKLLKIKAQKSEIAETHDLTHLCKEYIEQQKQHEEEQKVERERREKERLEQLKKKEKHEQSAIASSEVKQRLQEFVLSKKQREAAAGGASGARSNYRNWSRKHASLDQPSPPSASSISPRCKHALLGKYDDDFPLRKTASEPNLKVRSVLKQKVLERRSSPLLRRKDKGPIPLKRRPPTIPSDSSNNSELSSASPPNGTVIQPVTSINGSTPIQEVPVSSPYNPLNQTNIGDLMLYSSPSMPNISLGRPPVPNSPTDGKIMAVVSEAQVRAMATARLGMPLTSHVLHSSLPFYPALPVVDGEFTPPTSPSYIQQQMKGLEQTHGSYPNSSTVIAAGFPSGTMFSDMQATRLSRSIQRPLGRTQSAPLPLGHPMLQPQGVLLTLQQNEQYLREKQLFEQQQHNLLKQHIRQTVLTRAGSKSQVENVEEETEAAVAQEMHDFQPEIIDLTDGRSKDSEADCELAKQQKEREAFLQQQRDLMARHSLQFNENSSFITRHHISRPLSRTLSSPLVAVSPTGSPQESPVTTRHIFTTGVAYDSLMLKHQCICGNNSYHPEHGGRLQSIWARLQETGLISRCERVRSRKATLEEIQLCHSEVYTLLFGTNPLNRHKLDVNKLADLPIKNFVMMSCGGVGVDSDTTWNELHTANAARMAAGCVIELAFKVATGEIKNGFAVVRPPGHHAEYQQAMGFCFFNNIAIAAKQLRQRLKLEKILIVDWDVHHGNGIQQAFYDDPHILYISLHRHDDGNFFPGTGYPQEVGNEDGIGFNVNIAWNDSLNPPVGDAEYIAAFRTIVMPIAFDFDPEIVLVAAGFDAALGHPAPLGGYTVSPACFGYMTKQLMQLAKGRIVLALEGGYDLPSICDCTQECVGVLLGDEGTSLKEEEINRKPNDASVEVLQQLIAIQVPHWPCIKKWVHTVSYSLIEAQQKEKEVETVTALASLSVAVTHSQIQSPQSTVSVEEAEEPMEEDQDK